MAAPSQARHTHANVPIVSAADVSFIEAPVVNNACEVPTGSLPEQVRGRGDEVGKLLDFAARRSGQVVVLSGPAGGGKSTVALQAARELSRDRDVHWVSGHNLDMFIEGMAAVAVKLGAGDAEAARAQESGSHDLVWQLIPARITEQILVIDGADMPAFCSRAIRGALTLVQARWLTVVTTRVPDPSNLAGAEKAIFIRVNALPAKECADLMLDRIPKMADPRRRQQAMPAALKIAQLLGHVPLALHVAGSYQGSTVVRHTPASYLGELQKTPATRHSLNVGEPAYHLLPAINLALRGFGSEERGIALRLLGLLSSFAPAQPVPLDVLTAAGGGPDEPLVDRSVRLLIQTGLIHLTDYDQVQVALVHPLIARSAAMADGMRAARTAIGPVTATLDAVTETLDGGSATWADLGDTWPWWRLLIPHITHLLADPEMGSNPALLRTAHRAVRQMMARGMHRSAEKMAVAAVARAADLGDDSSSLRYITRLDHGLARQALGDDLELAFGDITYVALETRKARQDGQPEDAQTMAAQHHLAVLLHERGDLEESSTLFAKVQQAREIGLGVGHPDTLATMHCRAAVLHAAGQLTEAESLLRRTLVGRRGTLGPDHPDTIATLHSLAYVRQAAGGPESLIVAEREFGEVLAARRRILGETHPNTLITRHNLAWIVQANGEYEPAEAKFRTVMETQIARLGRSHPHTVATAANLAWVLLQQRYFDVARRLFTQVLKIRITRLGRDHPDTQTTRGNIGWLTYEEGDYHLAEYRFRKLVEDRKRLLPPNHPRTLTTRHNLALSLRSQNRFAEARDEFRAVLDVQQGIIKDDHESVLSTKYNLAVTLRMLNDESARRAAMDYLDEVLVAGPPRPLLAKTKREMVILLAIGSGRNDVYDLVDDTDDDATAVPRSQTQTDDPLVRRFVDADLDEFVDPDLIGYLPP